MLRWTLCCGCAWLMLVGDAPAQSQGTDSLEGRRSRDIVQYEVEDDGEVEVDDDSDVSGLVVDIFRRIGKVRRSARHARHKMKHQRRHGVVVPAPATPATREEPVAPPVDSEVAPAEDGDILVPPLPLPGDSEGSTAPLPPDAGPEFVDPTASAVPVPMSYRDRLLARRLDLINRLRTAAPDPAQQQQVDYLEGMVLQLHEQGLMNFAQKFIGTLQQSDTAPAADVPPVDEPELDLGEPAPLPSEDSESPIELPPLPAPMNN